MGGERIEVTVAALDDADEVARILARFSGGEVQRPRRRQLVAPISGGPPTFRKVLRAVEEAEIAVYDVGLRRPTLDDVFLALTGHAAEPAPERSEAPA